METLTFRVIQDWAIQNDTIIKTGESFQIIDRKIDNQMLLIKHKNKIIWITEYQFEAHAQYIKGIYL